MSFVEESSGTNAISMSIYLKEPVYISSEHNFCRFLTDWNCYTIPLQIQANGKIIFYYLSLVSLNKPLAKELKVITDLMGYRIVNEFIKKVNKENSSYINNICISKRQKAVLKLIAQGMTDSSIALTLGCSFGTIKYHKQNIFRKLNVSCSTEAVVKALKLNLLSLNEIEI